MRHPTDAQKAFFIETAVSPHTYFRYNGTMQDDNLSQESQPEDGAFIHDVETFLEDQQFRRKVMLFQRCDTVFNQLLTNLQEMNPRNTEERQVYIAFIEAAQRILPEMEPFLPPHTFDTLTKRLTLYQKRLK